MRLFLAPSIDCRLSSNALMKPSGVSLQPQFDVAALSLLIWVAAEVGRGGLFLDEGNRPFDQEERRRFGAGVRGSAALGPLVRLGLVFSCACSAGNEVSAPPLLAETPETIDYKKADTGSPLAHAPTNCMEAFPPYEHPEGIQGNTKENASPR